MIVTCIECEAEFTGPEFQSADGSAETDKSTLGDLVWKIEHKYTCSKRRKWPPPQHTPFRAHVRTIENMEAEGAGPIEACSKIDPFEQLLHWGEALERAAEKYKSADDVPASHIESHWGFVRDIVKALRARKSLRRCAHCRVELPSDEKFINDVYCEDVCHTRHCEIKDG